MRDVVVIGGGPAGLQLAYQLAHEGYDVVVFDDRSEIGKHKICSGIVSAEAFDHFRLPRSSILNQIQELKFVSPLGSRFNYTHPSVLAYIVNRTAFDKSLADRAAAQGAEIRVKKRVEKINLHHDCAEVETVDTEDESRREKHKGLLVAITTGVRSKLNKSVGLGEPSEFLNAAQAHIKVKDLECTTCFTGRSFAPGAFAWMVPLNQEQARVGLMAEARADHCFESLLNRIGEYRHAQPETLAVEFKPIVQRFVGKTYGDRVIAVGEAAGQVKTTTGGGIYYGMVCAQHGAQVFDQALRQKRYNAPVLSEYEHKWKSEIQSELNLGYLFRKAFARLSDNQMERLFSLASFDGIMPLIKTTAQFDWHADVLRSLARYVPVNKILGINLAEFQRLSRN